MPRVSVEEPHDALVRRQHLHHLPGSQEDGGSAVSQMAAAISNRTGAVHMSSQLAWASNSSMFL